MTTPLGSAVAPDVKMISATSWRAIATAGGFPSRHLVQLPDRRVDRRADRRHVLADRDQLRLDDAADAREKIGRGAIVDRHDDDADEQAAPERDDPFGTVLAPDDNFVAFAQAELVQPRREAARRASDFAIRVTAAPEPIVVDQEVAARVREIAEKVNQRVADHE
jgi:hypothetical protein